jgi:ribosome recycling factor
MKEVEKAVKAGMDATIDHLKGDLKAIRTGRATPSLLDRVMVDMHGHLVPLKSVATTSVLEGRNLVVTPFDGSTVSAVVKGIEAANLGLGQPRADGKVIRISIQPLNTDTRKQLAGECKKYAEKAKISLRKVRQEFNDKVKKLKTNGDMPEDIVNKCIDLIQKSTDKYVKDVDVLCAEKEKEIMTI